jgi:hypothetical protein
MAAELRAAACRPDAAFEIRPGSVGAGSSVIGISLVQRAGRFPHPLLPGNMPHQFGNFWIDIIATGRSHSARIFDESAI